MSLHTVFTSECNNHQFDWFATGVYKSFKSSGQQGSITRLLACSQEDLEHYKGLDIGPTFVYATRARGVLIHSSPLASVATDAWLIGSVCRMCVMCAGIQTTDTTP